MRKVERLEWELQELRMIVSRIYNELTDPMGASWCDRPGEDCDLLESLVIYIEDEMGWGDE